MRRRNAKRASVMLIVGLIASGLCAGGTLLLFALTGGIGGAGIGLLLALPTAAILVGLILLVDRLEPEPPLALIFAFAWGGGVAVVGSLLFEQLGDSFLHPVLHGGLANFVSTAVSAPLVEESCKGAALVLLLLFLRNEFDGPTDGVVYASMVALGFAMVENVEYYMDGLGPKGGLVFTVIMRGVISPLCHPLFTSMTGLGVAYAATHRGPTRVLAVVGGWLCAIGLHALWNGSTIIGLAGLALSYLILIVVLAGVIVVLVVDRQRLVRSIRTHLPPYVPSGLVTPPDVTMLGTIGGRRQARRWARGVAGVVGMRAMSDYQLAATELALLHANAAKRGMPPAEFYDRRAEIMDQMRTAQSKFFLRRPPVAPPAPPWAGRGQSSGFFELPRPVTAGALPDRPAPMPPRPGWPSSGPAQARPVNPRPPAAPRPPGPRPPSAPGGVDGPTIRSPRWPGGPQSR